MDYTKMILELERNFKTFHMLFEGYSNLDEFILWKQNQEKWSLLEILCHLIDEEREDFRTRVQFALESAAGQPPPIDPQDWVTSRDYIHQNYSDKFHEFAQERSQSLTWLKNLPEMDWNSYFVHPKFGNFTAKYLLSNWVAHDLLHIKQIIRLRYDYLLFMHGENLNYAGEWK